MTNSEKTVEINLGSEAVPGDVGVTTKVTEDSNKIVGLTISGDFQRQDLVTETDLLEERNRLGGTTEFQVQSLWTRRTPFEELSKLFPMWKFPTIEKKLPF